MVLVIGAATVAVAALAIGLLTGADDPVEPASRRLAPSFSLPDLRDPSAPQVSLPSGRPVVVYFFASWCIPCREELPVVQEVSSARDDVAFVGVDHLDQRDDGRDFLARFDATFAAGHDPGGDVALRYRVRGLPATVFVDADGRIASMFHGKLDRETLVARIDELTLHEGEG